MSDASTGMGLAYSTETYIPSYTAKVIGSSLWRLRCMPVPAETVHQTTLSGAAPGAK